MLKLLAIEMLAQSLNDVCGKDENPKARLKRYSKIEKEFDLEWSQIEKDCEKALKTWEREKKRIHTKIKNSNNKKQILRKIENKRKSVNKKIEQKLRSTKRAIRTNPERREELTEKFHAFVREIQEDFEAQKEYFESEINEEAVEARLKYSERVWEKNYETIKNRFLKKEDNHNKRRIQQDRIRIAIDWFIHDFDQVLRLCRIADVNVLDFYLEADRRMRKIDRERKEIRTIIRKIRRHEF